MLRAFAAARRRLLIIDYGGTIQNRDPESRSDFAMDGYSKHVPSHVTRALASLTSRAGTVVYVVSGLRSATVESTHLARIPRLGLAAENGMFVSYPAPGGAGDSSAGDALAYVLTEAFDAPGTPAVDGACAASGSSGGGASDAHSGSSSSSSSGGGGSLAAAAAAAAAAGNAEGTHHPGDFSVLGRVPPPGVPTGPHHGHAALAPPRAWGVSREAAGSGSGGGQHRHAALMSPPRLWTAMPLADAAAASAFDSGATAAAAASDKERAAAAPPSASPPPPLRVAAAVACDTPHTDGGGATRSTPGAASLSDDNDGSAGGGTPASRASGASGTTSSQQTARLLAEWADIKRRALGIMEDYQWRVNGSYVKEYDSLVAWDFRLADAEWAAPQAKFLASDLEAFASSAVKVTVRKTRVELSLRATNKGRLAASLLARSAHALQQQASSSSAAAVAAGGSGDSGPPFDFILVAGDDTTDEPMYEAAKEWAARHGCPAPFTVSIGHSGKRTCADALLPDVDAMQRLVVELAGQCA